MRMARNTWETLVARYADGRPICNCGAAYYSLDGIAWRGGKQVTNYPQCKHGCTVNQIAARDDIAERVLADLPSLPAFDVSE